MKACMGLLTATACIENRSLSTILLAIGEPEKVYCLVGHPSESRPERATPAPQKGNGMRTHIVICSVAVAVCASVGLGAAVNFVETWEDDTVGSPPGSPWYADPHMTEGTPSIVSDTDRFGNPGKGLRINTPATNGQNIGIQAKLVPNGQEVEATDTAKLTVGYWAISTLARPGDWYLEISLGDVHAPRLADVGTYNPLPQPIPVLAYCKPILEIGVLSKATYYFDGRQWIPHGFIDTDNAWANPRMTVSADSVYLVCSCNNNPADVPRAYLGRFDRVSIYSLDAWSTPTTILDELTISGGNVLHKLTVTPTNGLTSAGGIGGPFSPQCKTYTLANISAIPLDWSASKSQNWLDVTPAAGTLSAGASIDVEVCVNANANSLPVGPQADVVAFTNMTDNSIQNRTVQLYVGHVDAYTELFTTNNDLEHRSVLFTPDGSVAYYQACGSEATSFPVDPAGGNALTFSGENATLVTLAQGAQVSLYGSSYSSFYVGPNGYITFGSGDNKATGSLADHFAKQRISGLFTDLSPTSSQVAWKQLMDRAVVTYRDVVQAGTTEPNSFQIEMFYDGRIRITWLNLAASGWLAGLSRGNGTPGDYLPSDLSEYDACLPPTHHPADFDEDGDVDLADFGHLQLCLTGSGVLVVQPACANSDLNLDGDVDHHDVGQFVLCMSGSGVPPASGCLP